MHLLPGDPVRLALGEAATAEKIESVRSEFGLDKPLIVQYFTWVKNILIRFDFGKSILTGESVTSLIKRRLPVTLSLSIPALLIGAFLGVLVGVICAVKRGKVIDKILTIYANFCLGVPQFWIAIMGVFILSLKLHLIPLQGYTAPYDGFLDYVHHAIWPVICISIAAFSSLARQTRSNVLEVIQQDYVRTARANGIKESRIIFKHTLKNALIPVVTLIGMQMRSLVSGSIVIERVFNIPGLGNLLIRGVDSRDYLIVEACILIISIVTVFANFFVEIIYGLLDPRIRKSWR